MITQAEAARILGVSRARVGQMIDTGLLPAVERPVLTRFVQRADVERLKATPRRPGYPRGRPRTPAAGPRGREEGAE